MDQENAVNNALRDLKFRDIIKEIDSKEVEMVLAGLWASGYEYQREIDRKNRQGTNRRVTYFGQDDEPLGTYDSITIASNVLEIPRKTICHSLYHETVRMRNGHYFEYADDGKNRDTDTTGESQEHTVHSGDH